MKPNIKQITLRIDRDLLREIDALCGEVPRNRWINSNLRKLVDSKQVSKQKA